MALPSCRLRALAAKLAMLSFARATQEHGREPGRPSDVDRPAQCIRPTLEISREVFCPTTGASLAYRDEGVPVTRRRRQAPTRCCAAHFAKLLQSPKLDAATRCWSRLRYGLRRAPWCCRASPSGDRAGGRRRTRGPAAGAWRQVRVANVTVLQGDFAAGTPRQPPSTRLSWIRRRCRAGAASLLDQLKDGGRLAVVVGDRGCGRLTQWRRLGGNFDARVICDASAPALAAFEMPREFVF